MSKRAELAVIAAAARQHLELERAAGLDGVPIAPGRITRRRSDLRARRAAARAAAQPAAAPTPQQPAPAAQGVVPPPPRKSPAAAQLPFPAAPAAALSGRAAQLEALRKEMRAECRCPLAHNKLVFADGNPDADLMFIGEAPGEQEDLQGLPFVGPAGQLLTKIIDAMGLRRSEVYISNICKFRPPNNRLPTPDEVAACLPYLKRQIEIIQPKIIVALGNLSTHTLLQTTEGITRLRGRFVDFAPGIQLMPTFHPSYLLRDPRRKVEVWQDMKTIHTRMREMGLKIGELKTGKA